MTATTFQRAVRALYVERYQAGARHTQRMFLITFGLLAISFVGLGIYVKDISWFFAGSILFGVVGFAVAMMLRTVNYSFDPTDGSFVRIAKWAGYTCSTKLLFASDFTEIRIGSFTGRNQTYPVYWARLFGETRYTLVESGRRSEVWNVAEQVGELLDLPVIYNPRWS